MTRPRKPSKRQRALDAIKVAAYHNDDRTLIRIYVESPVSRAAMEAAREAGVQAYLAGTPCTCIDCTRSAAAAAAADPRPPESAIWSGSRLQAVEIHSGPDELSRYRYCLWRWRTYTAGHPAGENVARWGGQEFHTTLPTWARLPEPSAQEPAQARQEPA